MLFNSYVFILIFLPITLVVYYTLGKLMYHKAAIIWLVLSSLFFYSWWNPIYLYYLIGSLLINHIIALKLVDVNKIKFLNDKSVKKFLLIFGVTINLLLLGYFKYTDFFLVNMNSIFGFNYQLKNIILPLAISFFTFEQIAFLVDAYKGKAKRYDIFSHCLFVTFFPQLIAGPLVHHNEMLPQYERKSTFRFKPENLSIGISIFIIGLFKKVILADNVSLYATPIFSAAELNSTITFFEAWAGTLAYTLQIYFDFSGYSDMAIGLGRMFGILIPMNFYSPYKSINIIDFWRRWHITLSRFLRDYLYIPLGGNRKGKTRRIVNLMITMFLGGLWHGAGWTFVLWGLLHGFYLTINHGFHLFRVSWGHDLWKSNILSRLSSRFATFFCVLIAWVFFRAQTLNGSINLLKAMFGNNGFSFPEKFLHNWGNFHVILSSFGADFTGEKFVYGWGRGIGFIVVLYVIVWFLPNTQQFMKKYKPSLDIFIGEKGNSKYLDKLIWKPTKFYAISFAIITIILVFALSSPSEFLYFQF